MKLFKRLYDWVLHWANTPYGTLALFLIAFAESSFFPVPPDILLIALCLSIPKRAFRFALVCTIGSVLGGAFGYLLGWHFWDIAKGILFNYIDPEGFEKVRGYFIQYEAWAVGIAGFTPVPYKVFTLAAGFFRADFVVFIIASILSRGARFFIVAALLYRFGPPIRIFIDRYFNLLTIVFMALLIGGFILIRYVL